MPQKTSPKRRQRPPQKQPPPGLESKMKPRPKSERPGRRGTGRLQGSVGLITGGDSGIGRAVAAAFAEEGADVMVVYLNEHKDAEETKRMVECHGRRCAVLAGDVRKSEFCRKAVGRTLRELGRIDILVNNVAEQKPHDRFEDLTEAQIVRAFQTNILSYFFMTQAALPHLRSGSVIVNTASVTAYRGSAHLVDYAATKGAIVAFTRSLSQALVDRGIRVNAVAPGPVWTPLIASSFPPDKVATFGSDVPLGRAAEPAEIAPSYVFLSSRDASYMTGQVLHPNGGEIVNS